MTRPLLVGLLLFCAAPCFATPAFLKVFQQQYAGLPGVKNGCVNCHIKPPKRNDYGKAIEAKLGDDEALTVAILKSAENEDSDRDGVTNVEEIRAGSIPGDASSKPVAATGSSANASPSGAKTSEQPLIPEHTFHPALVHFPIALFMFGAFLEFWGRFRKSDELVRAAGWNLAFGFAGGLIAAVTGFIAAYRLGMGFPPSGDAKLHMLVAVGGTVAMALTLLARRRGGPIYLILLAGGALALGYAGHLGGLLVFGS